MENIMSFTNGLSKWLTGALTLLIVIVFFASIGVDGQTTNSYSLSPDQHTKIFGGSPTLSPIVKPELLNTERNVPVGISNRVKVNLGNHTQGFAILPNRCWAVSYTQHWNSNGPFGDLKSLLITGGKNHFAINEVPARNSIELSGIASYGNVIAAAWSDQTRFYRAYSPTNTLSLVNNVQLNSGNFVGFTKLGNTFYAVTGDDNKRGRFYRATGSMDTLQWGNPIAFANEGSQPVTFIKNSAVGPFEKLPKTHTGALALFTGGGKLYLGLMEYEVIETVGNTPIERLVYEKTDMVQKARNFVRFIEIMDRDGTPSYKVVRQFEVKSDVLYSGPNFRWGGTMTVNSSGQLEIYSIARLLNEGPNGGIQVFKITF